MILSLLSHFLYLSLNVKKKGKTRQLHTASRKGNKMMQRNPHVCVCVYRTSFLFELGRGSVFSHIVVSLSLSISRFWTEQIIIGIFDILDTAAPNAV